MPVGYHRHVPAASPTGPPGVQRIRSPLSALRRLGDSQEEFVQVVGGPPPVPRFTPAGDFQLTTLRRAIPCQRRRSRSHNDGQRLSTRATISIGTISNHGFWRKYLAASGVNDGFGCAP